MQNSSDADQADRHVALRVLGFLGRGRDRVEADIGEEDRRRRADRADAGAEAAEHAGGQERVEVGGCRSRGRVSAMKAVSATSLIVTSTALTLALSLVPIISSQVTSRAMISAGRLMNPPGAPPSASGPAVR